MTAEREVVGDTSIANGCTAATYELRNLFAYGHCACPPEAASGVADWAYIIK